MQKTSITTIPEIERATPSKIKAFQEEKLREIRSCAGSILSRLLTGDKQIEYVNELKDVSTSQRIDIIEAKRNIADELIKKGEYIF